jgi:hypothetical protein
MDLFDLNDSNSGDGRLHPPRTPGSVQIDAHTSQLHDGGAGRLTGARSYLQSALSQYRGLGYNFQQTPSLCGQASILASSYHKVYTVLLTDLQGLIKI